MDDNLRDRIGHYLRAHKPEWVGCQVLSVQRIHGGASRETYRLSVQYDEAGVAVTRGLVLRRDPVSTLIETEREVEYAAYRAFSGSTVPVPEPILLEREAGPLDRPFFVMAEITGAKAASILAGDPYAPHQAKIGAQFFTILGHIAAADLGAMQLPPCFAASSPTEVWRSQLDHWERVIDDDELEPTPVARAAIRWLRRNPPPPLARLSFVHGDYRTGNFLFRDDGTIAAILDWEMAHLGDPLEDLAWALDPLWAHHNPARPAGMLSRAEALALWSQASGLAINPEALAWWEMFASLKGLAIWISSAKEFQSGTNTDPVMAFSGLYCLPYHNEVLAERLHRLAQEGRL